MSYLTFISRFAVKQGRHVIFFFFSLRRVALVLQKCVAVGEVDLLHQFLVAVLLIRLIYGVNDTAQVLLYQQLV